MKSIIERLDDRTFYSPDGCWYWTGHTVTAGYGQMCFNGIYGAHRIAYVAHKGPIPDGLCVCHSCDNRRCINPDHLWLGTNRDNTLDKIEKGRGRNKWSGRVFNKLNESQVLEIRRSNESTGALAKRYSVARCTIHNIQKGKSWRYLITNL